MSFYRFIYFCALVGAWCAFIGWAVSECVPLPKSLHDTTWHVMLIAGLVGAGIGSGLNILSATAGGRWYQRLLPGFAGGLLGGALGGAMGNVLYSTLGWPRALGWMLMGLCIGCIEGAYERSPKKLRNGLIGGGLGGLVGGLLFDPIGNLVSSGELNAVLTSRATAFVVLGAAIGCLMGLVQVVFREAWLTVLDGYKPGRQLILSQPQTVLGRAEWAGLTFKGAFAAMLEMEHLRIVRQANGQFTAADNNTASGSQVNRRPIRGAVVLRDGDEIKIGNNLVRFNDKAKHDGTTASAPASAVQPASPSPPPPPPPPKRGAPAKPAADTVYTAAMIDTVEASPEAPVPPVVSPRPATPPPRTVPPPPRPSVVGNPPPPPPPPRPAK